MRTLWWALAVLGVAAVAAATPAPAPEGAEVFQKLSALHRRSAGIKKSRINKTIYKGRSAKARDIPFQVYVRVFRADGPTEFCGGAIIGPRHILSAAHCVQVPNVTRVCSVVGHEHRFHKQTQKFTVVRKHFYPMKNGEQIQADIVVFMVDRPIPVGRRNIHHVQLVGATQQLMPNTMCSISGWGQTDSTMDDRNLLRHAKVPIVKQELCQKAYPMLPPGDMLCAGYYEGGADSCKGDSGGPLVCRGQLTGIVRSGKGCGLPNYPGMYTDLRYYRRWIKQVITEDMWKEQATRSNESKYTNVC